MNDPSKLSEEHLNVLVLVFPERLSKLHAPLVAVGIENFRVCVPLQLGSPLNEGFLKSFLGATTSMSEIYYHLVPFPRLHFFLPVNYDQALLRTQTPIDLKRGSHLLSGVLFGSQDSQFYSSPAIRSTLAPLLPIKRFDSPVQDLFGVVNSSEILRFFEDLGLKEYSEYTPTGEYGPRHEQLLREKEQMFGILEKEPIYQALGGESFIQETVSNGLDLYAEYFQYGPQQTAVQEGGVVEPCYQNPDPG